MILTVTLNPSLDLSFFVGEIRPHETIRARGVRHLAGGKGVTVSRALLRLGETVRTLMPLGGHIGAYVAALASEEGLDPIVVPIAVQPRTVISVQESSTGHMWHASEPGPPVSEAEVVAIEIAYQEALEAAELVIISGSLPRNELAGLIVWMVRQAREAAVPTIVDTHGPGLTAALGAGPWMIKPNEQELSDALGEPLSSVHAQWQALRRVRESGIGVVLLSLGAAGVRAYWGNQQWVARPPAVTRVNAFGCGDSMVAGVAHAWRRGLTPPEALAWGVTCGAANAAVWDPGGFTREAAEALLPMVRLRRIDPWREESGIPYASGGASGKSSPPSAARQCRVDGPDHGEVFLTHPDDDARMDSGSLLASPGRPPARGQTAALSTRSSAGLSPADRSDSDDCS